MSAPMKLTIKHVTTRPNKDGSVRYYFFRRGMPKPVRLPDDPLSDAFKRAYDGLLDPRGEVVSRYEGTFAWMVDQYMDTPSFQTKAEATRSARRRVLLAMMREPLVRGYPETFGQEAVKNLTRAHIEILRDRKADAPNTANERLKCLTQVFRMAVAKGWMDTILTRDVERIGIASEGHQTATDEHLAAYMARHPSGMPNLAMRLLMAFGMRVSDLRRIGRGNVRNGVLTFTTFKTGVRCDLPVPSDLLPLLASDTEMVFMRTDYGNPFRSDKALSARISKWFRQAGVEGVTAHSVRKWLATKRAEDGATEMELMSWFGWRDAKEARPYVNQANRAKLASGMAQRLGNV